MKGLSSIAVILFSVMLAASLLIAQDKGAADGKKIFAANKCNMCHTLSAEKIEATGKSKAPDLSTVGSDKKPEWIQKFIKKEEQLKGKKHPYTFKGTETELKTLATWLAGHRKQ